MKSKMDELLDILEKETDCYRRMQTVLADEERAIGLTGRDRFERVQLEKEALVARIGKLEGLRRRLVDQLAPCGMDSERPITVSELAGMLGPSDNQKLLDSSKHLRLLIRDVQARNRRNQLLIDQYLNLVKGSLRLLTDLIDSSPTYQKPGARQPLAGRRPGAGRFIRGNV